MSTHVTAVAAADQQHLLLLFIPLKKGKLAEATAAAQELQQQHAATPPDIRAATGVHYFMICPIADGAKSTIPVTSFQTMPGKDMLLVMSLYDADFAPYISAFVTVP